ncbi:hypothetical protein QX776_01715 [Alteromonadaceae bacterium BrNp21-10]|nr:hypothetical protein [Alteromonadaceae bacterium BrNp21-10]
MNLADIQSNTSQWSLVVHKVSQTTVELWAGTLFGTLKKPQHAKILVKQNNDLIKTIDITLDQWQRPFAQIKHQRFYVFTSVDGLQAGQNYQVEFYRQLDLPEYADQWQLLRDAVFSTLPNALPTDAEGAFTIGLGSCFYEHRDGGQAAASYKALYDRADKIWQPDISFLVGDQVYLDIGFDSLSPITKEIRQRVADDYAKHWQALGSILSRGGTWMLPDDHEYWNDYPFYDTFVPTLVMLQVDYVRRAWTSTAKDGVENVQRSAKVDIFSIGNDVSFCVADLRSYRSKTQFIDQQGFAQMIDWAEGLTSPGVLVIPQILVNGKNKVERNLLSFPSQYNRLLTALASSGNDILVLSGDVHYGRIAQVKLGDNGAKLIEVVSSPMSNLTGFNSIATDTAKSSPEYFPDPKSLNKPSLTPQKVDYSDNYNVKSRRGFPGSAYWKKRTREHFMTVSLSKDSQGVKLNVEAWRVRQRDSKTNLPVKDFDHSFIATLNKKID